ncbi:MAG TPA: hypothetical protein VLC49_02490 [Solirubrobacteraceae bacterium]|nr:hypothetical protein [Solirubrobacteraceae bacterium]
MKLILAVVVLALGGLIAACGSSSTSSNTTTGSTTASAAAGGAPNASRRAALVACLKQHGVTLPARPPGARGGPPGSGSSGGSGTGTGTTGTGTTPRRGFFGGGGGFAANPKLRAAFQACGARFGSGGGRRFRLSRTAITRYVTCVRQHGYDLPSPNFSGKGPVFPSNIRGNAKFQAASRACQNLLAPPRPSGTSTTAGA